MGLLLNGYTSHDTLNLWYNRRQKYQVIDKGDGKIYEQKVEYYICAN